MFINVSKAYNFDNLSQQECNELIEKKITKEANRFIQQWPQEKIAIENGRWGPFIRFGKKMLKIGVNKEGNKYAPEELASISIEDVKKMIEAVEPGTFQKKTAVKKKAATKKTSPKAAKKATKRK